MHHRALLLAPIALCACGEKEPSALPLSGSSTPTPEEWARMDQDVCHAFDPPDEEVRRVSNN